MPNQSKLTKVRSVRATDEFWRKCDIMARLEKTDRNKLIVRVLNNYFNKKMKEYENKTKQE